MAQRRRVAEDLDAMLEGPEGLPSASDDDGERVDIGPEGDWFWQAHLLRQYLWQFENGQPPDADTILNIGRAYAALFNPLVQQRRAMVAARRWCKQLRENKALGLGRLIEDLHSLDFNVPRNFRLSQSESRGILGARRRPVSHATVLATIASAVGAFGVAKGSDVKTAARKLQRAFEATRAETNQKVGLRRKGMKSPRKAKI